MGRAGGCAARAGTLQQQRARIFSKQSEQRPDSAGTLAFVGLPCVLKTAPLLGVLSCRLSVCLSACCCSNGTVKWVFKNASIYKIPGTFNYEDINVNPNRMDIKAGNAIIHVISTL